MIYIPNIHVITKGNLKKNIKLLYSISARHLPFLHVLVSRKRTLHLSRQNIRVLFHHCCMLQEGFRATEMEGEMKKKLLNKEDKPGGEVEVEEEGQQQIKEKVWGETKRLWIVAGPAIFTRFSTFGINIISQAFIGHIGPTELAAYALVITVLLRFANGILVMFLTPKKKDYLHLFASLPYLFISLHLQY